MFKNWKVAVIAGAVLVAGSTGVALAEGNRSACKDKGKDKQARIAEFDANNDGKLDEAEARVMIDARAMRFETLSYAWDRDNPLSGEKPTIRDLSIHA